MNNSPDAPSLLQRTLNWIHQHAYQPAKNIFATKANNPPSPDKKLLLFSNIANNQTESKKIALACIRNRHKKTDEKEDGSDLLEKLKKVSHFWGKRQEAEERPPELVCPICMDFLVGGVSTKCGHTFCWQCLDEAVLLNPGCPVCRNEIRGTDFTLSQELTAIIRRYLKRCPNQKERERELTFNARADEFQEWLLLRVLNPLRVKSSDLVDVRDTEHIWCSGLIKQIWDIQRKTVVLVHYLGWSSLYDEIIPLDSQRLASYRLYSSRKDIPHYQLEPDRDHLQGFVVELPPPDEDSFSEEGSQELVEEFENINIEIIQENEDEELMQMSSAKPFHFENPEE